MHIRQSWNPTPKILDLLKALLKYHVGHNMGKGPFRQNFDNLRFKFFREGNFSEVEYFLFD